MSPSDDKLARYRRKRDPRRTREPMGEEARHGGDDERPIFVIQQHDASTLHYDFRLEVDGVLRSWAVPKGPSTDPRVKRLAIPTEDHPLAYADFEGVIPAGEYGAGSVLIWDRGHYRTLEEDDDAPSVAEQLADGHATIWLEGHKLRGGYALIHTRLEKGRDWLLIKIDDAAADARRNPVSTEPASVVSGRTLGEIAAEEGKDDA
ncbi:DNA polymerase ligase N-terminal domain-containing protein [Halomonas stenophila]|uniref:DNA ligase D-like protein (Predicted 3'-phosphoesterase) n=1 Tax=Halomonas stenophila TaxID=795312 RepID=A0A7W5EWA8_9GAMM|nr:DNA polymerase ligase N-terminal domain-containing protein [Halomonas stenophila]MBB3231856.1 DNA ligase D-like protein (predicted 3'-phosphoesterase) [Halomonas stenophila]